MNERDYVIRSFLSELLMTIVTLHQDRITTEDTGHCIGLTED